MTSRTLAAAAALVLLAGCATAPAPTPEPSRDVADESPAATPRDEANVTAAREPAVVALHRRAEKRLDAGDLEASAATLERALGIDPDDAELWLELGWVRLALGDAGQAEVLAERARRLASTPRTDCEAVRLLRAAGADLAQALKARDLARADCRRRWG